MVSTGPCRRSPLVEVGTGRVYAVEVAPGWGIHGVVACLESTARALPAWRAQLGRPGVSIVVDLALAELVGLDGHDLCELFARCDLGPEALVVRVPRFGVGDPTAELDRLAELGVSISIASLDLRGAGAGLLAGAPIDLIELSPSAVGAVDAIGEAAADLDVTIDVAHRHDWLPVARDVARPEQLAALRRLGCDLASGPAVTQIWPAIDAAFARLPAPLAS
jgi:EAL domain-containing protein (putative c-di-GMP-specific phosphodiesterase class I)